MLSARLEWPIDGPLAETFLNDYARALLPLIAEEPRASRDLMRQWKRYGGRLPATCRVDDLGFSEGVRLLRDAGLIERYDSQIRLSPRGAMLRASLRQLIPGPSATSDLDPYDREVWALTLMRWGMVPLNYLAASPDDVAADDMMHLPAYLGMTKWTQTAEEIGLLRVIRTQPTEEHSWGIQSIRLTPGGRMAMGALTLPASHERDLEAPVPERPIVIVPVTQDLESWNETETIEAMARWCRRPCTVISASGLASALAAWPADLPHPVLVGPPTYNFNRALRPICANSDWRDIQVLLYCVTPEGMEDLVAAQPARFTLVHPRRAAGLARDGGFAAADQRADAALMTVPTREVAGPGA